MKKTKMVVWLSRWRALPRRTNIRALRTIDILGLNRLDRLNKKRADYWQKCLDEIAEYGVDGPQVLRCVRQASAITKLKRDGGLLLRVLFGVGGMHSQECASAPDRLGFRTLADAVDPRISSSVVLLVTGVPARIGCAHTDRWLLAFSFPCRQSRRGNQQQTHFGGLMNTTPVRVGIIGLGRSGWSIHALGLQQMPEHYRIVAVADLIEARRIEAQQTFGCRAYAGYGELPGRSGGRVGDRGPAELPARGLHHRGAAGRQGGRLREADGAEPGRRRQHARRRPPHRLAPHHVPESPLRSQLSQGARDHRIRRARPHPPDQADGPLLRPALGLADVARLCRRPTAQQRRSLPRPIAATDGSGQLQLALSPVVALPACRSSRPSSIAP